MTYTKATRTDRQLISNEARAFGAFDAKGREHGYRVAITREVWVADENSGWSVKSNRLGAECFLVEPQAMRGGQKFGAVPVNAMRVASTLDEAKAIAAEMFAKAAKKAAR